MSATDELRALLDERGVEWDYGITGATSTRFSANGVDVTLVPSRDGLVCSTILTPAQAIAATLPRAVDKGEPQGADGHLDQSQVDWLRLMPDGWDGTPPETAREMEVEVVS